MPCAVERREQRSGRLAGIRAVQNESARGQAVQSAVLLEALQHILLPVSACVWKHKRERFKFVHLAETESSKMQTSLHLDANGVLQTESSKTIANEPQCIADSHCIVVQGDPTVFI